MMMYGDDHKTKLGYYMRHLEWISEFFMWSRTWEVEAQ